MQFQNIAALIFDMDGTLVDSEGNTEIAVRELLEEQKQDLSRLTDYKQFHGRTWKAIADILRSHYPGLGSRTESIEGDLQHSFHRLFPDSPEIPGAMDFFRAANRAGLKTGIATSSNRESVLSLVERFSLADVADVIIGAEDYDKSKPDPECYVLAADRVGIKPDQMIVFEDSIAGLKAARSSGAGSVAITHSSPNRELACELSDLCVESYLKLPPDFISSIQST